MDVITTNAELEAFCARMALQPFVAVDTEFMRETTYWPKLCLVQVCGADGDAAAIDPLADDLEPDPLLDLLENPEVLKVFHAARQDIEIFNNLGVLPEPLFDTQVAAMAAGFGEQIAYDALMRQLVNADIDKSSRFTDWSRRPLADSQLSYALADVTHLARAYPKLRDRLDRDGRLAWVQEEMGSLIDPAYYDTDPEKAWQRLKPRKYTPKYLAVFKAVAAWRERTAQDRDTPRGRVLKDDAIDELAAQAPTTPEALERLRSVPKGYGGSRYGPALLDAIRAALVDPEAYAPKIERAPPPPQNAGAAVELLKVLLKARAEEAGVASKLIATVSDLERIAAGDPDATPLHGWRRQVFGEDALRLHRGELALVLNGARVRVIEASADDAHVAGEVKRVRQR